MCRPLSQCAARIEQTGAASAQILLSNCTAEQPFSLTAWLYAEDSTLLATASGSSITHASLSWASSQTPTHLDGIAHILVNGSHGTACFTVAAPPVETWRYAVERFGASNRNSNHDEDPAALERDARLASAFRPRLAIDYERRLLNVSVHLEAADLDATSLVFAEDDSALIIGLSRLEPAVPLSEYSNTWHFPYDSVSLMGCAAVANTLLCSEPLSLAPFAVAALEAANRIQACEGCIAARARVADVVEMHQVAPNCYPSELYVKSAGALLGFSRSSALTVRLTPDSGSLLLDAYLFCAPDVALHHRRFNITTLNSELRATRDAMRARLAQPGDESVNAGSGSSIAPGFDGSSELPPVLLRSAPGDSTSATARLSLAHHLDWMALPLIVCMVLLVGRVDQQRLLAAQDPFSRFGRAIVSRTEISSVELVEHASLPRGR